MPNPKPVDPYVAAAELRALRQKLAALEARFCSLTQRREVLEQELRDVETQIVGLESEYRALAGDVELADLEGAPRG